MARPTTIPALMVLEIALTGQMHTSTTPTRRFWCLSLVLVVPVPLLTIARRMRSVRIRSGDHGRRRLTTDVHRILLQIDEALKFFNHLIQRDVFCLVDPQQQEHPDARFLSKFELLHEFGHSNCFSLSSCSLKSTHVEWPYQNSL